MAPTGKRSSMSLLRPPSIVSRTGLPLIRRRMGPELTRTWSPRAAIVLRSVRYPLDAFNPGTRLRMSLSVVPPKRFKSSADKTVMMPGASDCFSANFDTVVTSTFSSSSSDKSDASAPRAVVPSEETACAGPEADVPLEAASWAKALPSTAEIAAPIDTTNRATRLAIAFAEELAGVRGVETFRRRPLFRLSIGALTFDCLERTASSRGPYDTGTDLRRRFFRGRPCRRRSRCVRVGHTGCSDGISKGPRTGGIVAAPANDPRCRAAPTDSACHRGHAPGRRGLAGAARTSGGASPQAGRLCFPSARRQIQRGGKGAAGTSAGSRRHGVRPLSRLRGGLRKRPAGRRCLHRPGPRVPRGAVVAARKARGRERGGLCARFHGPAARWPAVGQDHRGSRPDGTRGYPVVLESAAQDQ